MTQDPKTPAPDADKNWRRDAVEPGPDAQLGADGDSDDVHDSPTQGHGGRPTPGQGDSDDVADDR